VGEVMSGAADDYLRYFLGVEDMCIPYNNKKVSGRVSICHPDDGRSRENQTSSMLQTYSCRETRWHGGVIIIMLLIDTLLA